MRTYRPRNPIDPGSKLHPGETLTIILWLLAGRTGDWIARKEQVSKNTVTSVSRKFREKLLNRREFRQIFFDYLHGNEIISRDEYTRYSYLPANYMEPYFRDAPRCIFRCPTEYFLTENRWERHMIKAKRGGPNFMKRRFSIWWMYEGDGLSYRDCAAEACDATKWSISSEPGFPILFRHYLRERRLGEKNVKDYFLLFSLVFYFQILSMRHSGIQWRELREGKDWENFDAMKLPETGRMEFTQAYTDALLANATKVLTDARTYLMHDPLD